MKILFGSVGREKQTWIAEMPMIDYPTLLREIRKHHALMSRDIMFDLDEQTITAGDRLVGTITLLDEEPL